jgi:hypothetical protein
MPLASMTKIERSIGFGTNCVNHRLNAGRAMIVCCTTNALKHQAVDQHGLPKSSRGPGVDVLRDQNTSDKAHGIAKGEKKRDVTDYAEHEDRNALHWVRSSIGKGQRLLTASTRTCGITQ